MAVISVAAVQFCPKPAQVQDNLRCLSGWITQAADQGATLVVLPEVCDIGYEFDAIANLASTFPNESTAFFSDLSRKLHMTIVAGLAERRPDGIYNTAAVFGPNGQIAFQYDKSHLCPYQPLYEPDFFRAGTTIQTVDVAGVRLGVTICYDIRFPEIYRKLALDGAQIILHPSAFPLKRIDQLEVCARARAIENQVFVVTSNLCGRVDQGEYGGRSMGIGPAGEIRGQVSEQDEGVVVMRLDLAEIAAIRRELPVISMRREELYRG